jgi:hypothetical protein
MGPFTKALGSVSVTCIVESTQHAQLSTSPLLIQTAHLATLYHNDMVAHIVCSFTP